MTQLLEDYRAIVNAAANGDNIADLETYRTHLMTQLGFDESAWKSDVAAERERLKNEHQAKTNVPVEGNRVPKAGPSSDNVLADAAAAQIKNNQARAAAIFGVRSRGLKMSRGEQESVADRLRRDDQEWAKSFER